MTRETTGTVTSLATSLHGKVEVQQTQMRIHDLSIERPEVVDYLRGISPDKQEIALVHAIEVGVKEILARRGRQRLSS